MDTTEFKKMVNTYVDDVNTRLSKIESNVNKSNSWSLIHSKIKANTSRTDESVLEEMTMLFGSGCLKALILSVAENYIEKFDNTITAQSCDLKMLIGKGPVE